MTVLRRGVIAGLAGTTVLNVVTYADMAIRGRDASTMPEDTVEAALARAGRDLPGSRSERSNRGTALGALGGITAGLGVGVAGAALRRAGIRLPGPLEAAVIGAAAMAATDGPAVVLGVTDVRTWSRADWIADAAPHLAYGIGASAALRATEHGDLPGQHGRPVRPARPGLVLRSALLGIATGCRSSLGVAGSVIASGAPAPVRAGALLAVAGEVTADKLPSTPDRTGLPGVAPRFAGAAAGATALARREQANAALPIVAGAAGAAAGTWGGLAWRRWASARMPALQAGLIEDGVALALTALAIRSRRP